MAELQARMDAFRGCYVEALERDRETEGRVGLLLEIDEDPGQVSSSTVDETNIRDAQMPQCVADAASDISLPEPPGVPVEGHYDVNFGFE